MKYVKILGLAAVAAMALMAWAGVGSASADVLCTKNNTFLCPAGSLITEIQASLVKGGTAKLTDTSGNTLDTCTGSSVAGKIEKQGKGVEPEGKLTAVTWSGCTQNPTTTTTLGSLKIETKEVSPGVFVHTVTAFGSEVTINTIFGSCTYGAGAGISLGNLALGEPAKLPINTNVTKTAGGGLCPSSGKWVAEYQITNHNAVFISAE